MFIRGERFLTAFRLQQDPKLNVIIGSYNQQLANRFSRKIRRVLSEAESIKNGELRITNDESENSNAKTQGRKDARSEPGAGETIDLLSLKGTKIIAQGKAEGRHPGYIAHDDRLPEGEQQSKRIAERDDSPCRFPFPSSRPVNSVAEWETLEGGGLRAVGVGGGVTGYGAGLIVIDDPVKSRAEAESQTYRDNIWDWFNDDLYTRLEPNGAIILIQTRWHEDDLAGRLLREAKEEGGEQWEVVNLPALAEGAELRNEESESMSVPPAVAGGAVDLNAKTQGRLISCP